LLLADEALDERRCLLSHFDDAMLERGLQEGLEAEDELAPVCLGAQWAVAERAAEKPRLAR